MPFTRRAVFALAAVGAVVIGSALVGGCGAGRSATGFCATIRAGHPAFDSVDETNAPLALAEFDRVAAHAPAAVAPDLETVSSVLRSLYRDPASVANNPPLFERYVAATKRVDRYLHQTCGVTVPPPGKFF